MKKIIAIYLSIFLFITGALSTPVISYATIDTDKIVQGYTSSFATGAFSYAGTNKYYVLEDPSDIPSHNGIAFFGKNGQEFYIADGKEVFTYVINKQLGVVVKPGTLANLFSEYVSAIQLMVNSGNKIEDGLYDGNGNFLGLCMADISGCYYQGAANVTIPANTIVNIYNFIKDELPDDSPLYFNVSCNFEVDFEDDIDDDIYAAAIGSGAYVIRPVTYNKSGGYYYFYASTLLQNSAVGIPSSYDCIALYKSSPSASELTAWATFCQRYNLATGSTFTEVFDGGTSNNYLQFSFVNCSDLSTFNNWDMWSYYQDEVIESNNQSIGNASCQFGENSTRIYYCMGNFTLYRDAAAFATVNSGSYENNYFITQNLKEFNVSTVTDVTVSAQYINNSTTNNETIYTQGDTIWTENNDNGQINNGYINNGIIEIINIYYPDPTPDPGGTGNSGEGNSGSNEGSSDNSGEGNSGEGGNGGSGDGGITLDALLAALLAFFDAIGKVIATIITGLLTIFTDVLNALASIQDMFSGITAFFGALFGYLPEPIPAVLAAGVCLVILCAIIKFIRG